ncbi:hypothetical protein [Maribacter sp. 2210JD10-5]|uniref:hypothetical protein n=1 Tax=Maribacter sp. 2210JD10-5 TaxID=3386272 RepID=UPI0039BCD0F4
MALLKKIKASTLMETLVATVLIVIIFMTSSMLLNNLLRQNVKQNIEAVEERLNSLEYQYKNGILKLPYHEDFESWEISIFKEEYNGVAFVALEAENAKTKKQVINYIGNVN